MPDQQSCAERAAIGGVVGGAIGAAVGGTAGTLALPVGGSVGGGCGGAVVGTGIGIVVGGVIGHVGSELALFAEDIFSDWPWWKDDVGDPPASPLDPEKERCAAVKAGCIAMCSETALDPSKKCDQGMGFNRCYNDCMEEAGCVGR